MVFKSKLYSLIGRLLAAGAMLVFALSSTYGGSAGSTAEAEAGLKVTVLLFSGRPDPIYTIDDKNAVDKVRSLVSSAKPNEKFERSTVIPSVLGYKGIMIENRAKIPGIPSFIAVYKGTMEVKDEKTTFLIDEGRVLETMLLDMALQKKAITEKMHKSMQSER
jgi:hypothetical protein